MTEPAGPTPLVSTVPASPWVAPGGPPTFPPPAPPIARRPPGRATVAALVVGAVGTDIAMWAERPGIGWALGATAAAAAVAWAARPSRPATWALLAAVPALAVWCVLRDSPWLAAFNLVAINVCLVLATGLAHRGSWFDRSLAAIVDRSGDLLASALLWPAWVAGLRQARPVDGEPDHERRDLSGIALGLVLAVPLVLIIGALLASADAVFASFLDLGISGDAVVRHVVALALGVAAVAALLRHAAAEDEPARVDHRSVAASTGNVLLGALVAVFGVYAVSRLLALTGAAERIAETRGLTWAEYARSGFFQLLAVAAVTLVVLLSVRGACVRGTDRQVRARRVLGIAAAVMVIGIVVDAIVRLAGYERAYGLTMLRLGSTIFAVWLGIVFVVVGASFVGDYDGRRWLTGAITALALAGLFVANVMNPEAVVAHRNLTGPTRAGETDLDYLGTLSGDAAGEIDAALDSRSATERRTLLARWCTRWSYDEFYEPTSDPLLQRSRSWTELNVADRAFTDILRERCAA